MPGFRFDIDTAGEVIDDRTVRVRLDAEWNVDGRILNGGYLQAVAVRAAAAILGTRSGAVAVSTSFASPAIPGVADVTVTVLRRGRRLSAVSATVAQDGGIVLVCLATFADLPDPADPADARPAALTAPVDHSAPTTSAGLGVPTAGLAVPTAPAGSAVPMAPAGSDVPTAPADQAVPTVAADLAAPTVPAEESARTTSRAAPGLRMPRVTGAADSIRVPAERLPGPPGLARLLDLAFVPEDSGWLSGDTSAGPRIRCWLSFADHRPLDALAVIAMADMAPPVSFAQGTFGWAPTLHLQVGVFARPSSEHLLLDLRGEPYDGAFVAEDGLLWDARGTLVARSRQIAVPPRR